ncbi:hypothetical protein Q5752_005898 [Cryptotrichosporon argae]
MQQVEQEMAALRLDEDAQVTALEQETVLLERQNADMAATIWPPRLPTPLAALATTSEERDLAQAQLAARQAQLETAQPQLGSTAEQLVATSTNLTAALALHLAITCNVLVHRRILGAAVRHMVEV